MKRSFLRTTAILALTLWCGLGHGDEYPDVATVLKRISDQPKAVAKTTETPANLKIDLEAYQKNRATMSPEQSAAKWLELFDRQAKLRQASGESRPSRWRYDPKDENALDVRDLILALPPPEHWKALAAAIDARPKPAGEPVTSDLALRMLGSVLANRPDRKQLLEVLRQSDENFDNRLSSNGPAVLAVLAGEEPEPVDAVRAFEEKLEQPAESFETLIVPDLVTLAGREKAAALLVKALTNSNWKIEQVTGEATKSLARETALKHVQELKLPQWALVDSPAAMELYAALSERFPSPKPKSKQPLSALFRRIVGDDGGDEPDDSARQLAAAWYIAGLIAAGRIEEAVAAARELPKEDQYAFSDAFDFSSADQELKLKAYEFLQKLTGENPTPFYWEKYIALGAVLGKSDEALEAVRAAAGRPESSAKDREQLQDVLLAALLAADRTEEALEKLRSAIMETANRPQSIETPLRLATLGILLGKQDLATEGVDAAIKMVKDGSLREKDWNRQQSIIQLSRCLAELNRCPEAVDLLITTMQVTRQATTDGPFAAYSNRRGTQTLLVELVSLYNRAGRHADVVQFLDAVPYWEQPDLATFLTQNDSNGKPIGYLAATALAATGRNESARKIVDRLLELGPGDDDSYALLLRLIPDHKAAIATLDELFAADQFQERPLIWKAELLRLERRLDEAEATIRKAIAIDPSDGEQPRGDRMRAYSVLADILDAKGNAEEAQIYRNVMKAIRLAEDADQLASAGLYRRAIALYKKSLELFQDAYCIQVRLAVKLASAGNLKEAEPHFRKAFELMPDSFGRIESHCFGCEGAFEGPLADRIAEEVFVRFVNDNPTKPQVHYLLAYLREQQGRPHEALAPLQQAVRLDPDYLNAWKSIVSLPDDVPISMAERETANFNLIRLDPRQKHSSADLTKVRDLRALWSAVESAAKFRTPSPESLYPLPAAKAHLKSEEGPSSRSHARTQFDHLASPAHALLATPAFEVLTELMDGN